MKTRSRINPGIFDAEVLALVQSIIPAERVRGYLLDLDRQFTRLVGSDVADMTLETQAHKIVSQAGMLGLTRMSVCAREVENAPETGSARLVALRRCRQAIEDIQLYAIPATVR